MLVSLTVGKVDAGVAVLLTEDKRLIEFPSILLPPDISSGSIVDITVARNLQSEAAADSAFSNLQNTIFRTFGQRAPSPPVLRCRNATQTSVVLEWDPVDIATASLRSLSLYRNGSKAGTIPRPTETLSTKISGLAVDTEYTFHLVLRTSAGTFNSERLTVRTHKMTELSGITITPGVMPAQLKESLHKTAEKIGAKIVDQVRIDTTHFVCTEGRGQLWERAVETNVPVVVPDWLIGCEREGRIVGVRGYYLNADPRLRQVGPGVQQQQQKSPQPSPRTEVTPPTPDRTTAAGTAKEDDVESEDDEEGPPPPPKTDETDAPPEPKTATEEPKARVEDVKPSSSHGEEGPDNDDEDSNGTETDDYDEKASEAGHIPVRTKQQGGTDTPDNEKFDDVAL
ncbi:hypothetical protein EJ05DRAFT_444772 [Pseudovirgaria hyperparasitica]|uniref:Chitin biosynthesis protein n=1 Tax=Pseudovirgaria hyperparasitica TaxID=470096 RepID=A0A6A6VUB6_9PEZI|nr:uncharacterized protein EJ05DRAFT_444772 [Pseudovirgaria hyperparasitica]KAF2753489.1 hypothetical protein EJ05DRAFT_444772 [Pseudovirgaria hyperparasitica]